MIRMNSMRKTQKREIEKPIAELKDSKETEENE